MAQAPSPASPVAVIDEKVCIGCTLCIQACPVDAIVGAAKLMHTVVAAECTGCKLCLPPCPVDCISMVETLEVWTREERVRRSGQYRRRYEARMARLEREEELAAGSEAAAEQRKRATVAKAMERARQRLQQHRKSDR